MKRLIALVLPFTLLVLGCATSFTGEAHVPDGPRGCEAKCRSWGLEFVGMVAMGEYSDGCICRKPGAQVALSNAAAAAEGAVSGVWMQTQRARQNASQ